MTKCRPTAGFIDGKTTPEGWVTKACGTARNKICGRANEHVVERALESRTHIERWPADVTPYTRIPSE